MLYISKASLYYSVFSVPKENYTGKKFSSGICPDVSYKNTGADLLLYFPEFRGN